VVQIPLNEEVENRHIPAAILDKLVEFNCGRFAQITKIVKTPHGLLGHGFYAPMGSTAYRAVSLL
jgi:hypothetical protein